jgi:glycosidase
MSRRQLCAILLALCTWSAGAQAADAIDHVEPPHWWVGMQSPTLQLMLHGPRLAEFTPQLNARGVRVLRSTRSANPNYLFVDLDLQPDAPPQVLDLRLQRGRELLHRPYELRAREPGSAERRGFDARDVILNLVPDRFANGDPSNDNRPGMPDEAKRADDQAGRHGGDIRGIAEHLDFIAAMGYTMLWPTPLLENNQPAYSYHGYAITDLYRVDPRFGSNDDYLRMVAAARAKGVGVIQDIVLNHIGSGHWWLRDLPAPDWLTHEARFVPTMHARTAVSDPYASQEDRRDFTEGWFGPNMPDLNQKNPLLATYLIQYTLWWIEEAKLSGLRIDTYGYSDTAFLADWSRRVMQEYPNFSLVGEEWSANPVVVSYWLAGQPDTRGYRSSMPGMIDFPLHEALRRALTADEGMFTGFNELYAALANDRLYPDPMRMVVFEGNHDVPRLFSVLHEDLALWKMAIVYVLTTRGVPQLYYGTDVLMTSPTQRDDGATRRDYPGGWAGDKVNGFTGEGLTAQQREAQAFLRKLLNWRRGASEIHHGRLMHYAPERGTYTYFRYDERRKLMVAMNKSREAVTLPTARFHEMLAGITSARDVLSGHTVDLHESLTVPARGVLLLELK